MPRRGSGFTLIELLVVVAIMATMVTVSVVNVRAGQGAARVRGATRDVYAWMRHARSMALVTQKPSVVTYSTSREDDEVCARVEVAAATIMNRNAATSAMTLDGQVVSLSPDGDATLETRRRSHTVNGEAAETGGEGTMVEDVLFAPVASDVVKGMRLKVLREDEELEVREGARAKPKISVFSNVDYLIGKFAAAKEKESAEKKEAEADSRAASAGDEDQESVSFVWEVNGRTEPHRVWVYADGSSPEKGLCIKVDRFGAMKVVSHGEDE